MKAHFRIIFSFFAVMLSSVSGFAIDDDIVRIKNLSSSGKTLYLNRGKFDDVKEEVKTVPLL